MILDGLLIFSGTSMGASGGVASGPQTDAPTTGTQVASNIIDLGITNGLPTSAAGGGARDIGTGNDPRLSLFARAITAFAGGTSLQLILAGAPDNGSGAPGAYTTMFTSPTFAESALVIGAELCNIDIPRAVWEQVLPRYLQLSYVSVGTHTAGTIEAGIVGVNDEQVIGPTGFISGYQPGVNVPN